MKRGTVIGLNRVGSFYNFPNWRYQIYLNPSKAGLAKGVRKPKPGEAVLKRYSSFPGVKDTITVNDTFPAGFQRVVNKLSLKNREVFNKLFWGNLKKRGDSRVFSDTYEGNVQVWDLSVVDALTDDFLKRLLYHVSNVKHDHYIHFAVGLKLSKDHEYIFRSLGYHIYAGLSDREIAKRFRLYPGQIEAVRNLFYDFSSAPRDVTALFAYLTQLVDNEIITDLDKRYYKLINELGDVGLRAHANFHSLSEDQKIRVQAYLGDSMLENVLSLNFAVTDMRDAINFNGVINNLASFYIKKEEVNYYRAKVRNLDASTVKLVNDSSQDAGMIDDEDREALKLIGTLALKENSLPEYKSITELNSF